MRNTDETFWKFFERSMSQLCVRFEWDKVGQPGHTTVPGARVVCLSPPSKGTGTIPLTWGYGLDKLDVCLRKWTAVRNGETTGQPFLS